MLVALISQKDKEIKSFWEGSGEGGEASWRKREVLL